MLQERALLLTDVVDSTRMAQQLGDEAAARLWTAHDRAARDLLPAWRGREIDKTDGLLLLFESADDALHYALAYHRALAALPVPLRARAGLHVGAVLLRANLLADVARGAKPLEVEGLAKSLAARVMALAQGGQTLLTDAACRALGATGLRQQSHGHWRLPGVNEPVELFEVGDEHTVFAPPPDGDKGQRVVRVPDRWQAVREVANNLPQALNAFVGRDDDLRRVQEALVASRLVTLLGTGGIGKTRLALQVAARAQPDFSDGVWLVELAALADGPEVVQAVASALRVKEVPGSPVADALAGHLKDRQLLLVLDNCEHVLPDCAALVRRLLDTAPRLVLLATSRERLRVAGESVHALAPLRVPEGPLPSPSDLARIESVCLLAERAQAVQPGFVIDAHNAAGIADICRRLDGIPLALELAAARLRALSVEAVAKRLADRFRLLTGGERTALPRQQTLRAMVDWSHDLLAAPERILLRRLGVFAGGWTLEAAEAVAAGADLPAGDVAPCLAQLVDKSLVAVSADGGRYHLLETIRAYALERLAEAGEEADLRSRHLEHFLSLARQAGRQLWGGEQGAWVRRLDRERENLLAAHAWCDGAAERALAGLRLVYALQLYWLPAGLLELGHRLTCEALARPGAQGPLVERCGAHYAAAQLAFFLSRFDATLADGELSLALARTIGAPDRAIDALLIMGYAADERGQAAGALARYEEAIALARESGDRARLSYALNALAGHRMPGRAAEALPLYVESAALAREAGDRDALAVTLQNAGRALLELGQPEAARPHLQESIAIADELGARQSLLYVLDACCVLAGLESDAVRVAHLRGAVDAESERLGLQRTASDQQMVESPCAAARAALGPAAYAAAESAGRAAGLAATVEATRDWLRRDRAAALSSG